MKYVDAHCHLDLYPDYAKVAGAAEAAEIAMVTMTTTPRAWPRNVELAARFKDVVPALGYHPQLVSSLNDELAVFDEYLDQARFIGEIGLDASPKHYKSFDAQKRIFSRILQKCSVAGDRVLSVHTVRAAKVALDLIEDSRAIDSGCNVILHWFTGGTSEGRRAIKMGCYFSINPAMLEQAHHNNLLSEIPADRLLIESDGPFARSAAGPIGPTSMPDALLNLAQLRKMPVEDMRKAILENYCQLVRT